MFFFLFALVSYHFVEIILKTLEASEVLNLILYTNVHEFKTYFIRDVHKKVINMLKCCVNQKL